MILMSASWNFSSPTRTNFSLAYGDLGQGGQVRSLLGHCLICDLTAAYHDSNARASSASTNSLLPSLGVQLARL